MALKLLSLSLISSYVYLLNQIFFSSINDKPSFLLLQKDEDKDKMMASLKSSASTRQVFHEQFEGLITLAYNGDAEAIASLAALVDNSQTRGAGPGKSSDVFRCSTLDMNNKFKMENNGGSKQFNLYLAFMKFKDIFTFSIPPNPNAPAGCPSIDEGFGIMPCKPDDPLTKKILGPHENYLELIAVTAGAVDWRTLLGTTLKKSCGWNQHPKTYAGPGRPSLVNQRKEKFGLRLFYKADCKFSSGGPGRYGGGEARAAYQKKWNKANGKR